MKTTAYNAFHAAGRRPALAGMLVWLFTVPVLAFAGQKTLALPPEASPTVTITGAIANIDDIGPFVVSGTFLQLYPCDVSGKIQLKADSTGRPAAADPNRKFYIDKMGRLVPGSGLTKTLFPDYGTFSFDQAKGLKPGQCYKICMMMLDQPYPGMVPVTGPDGKIRKIIIPEAKGAGGNQHIVIDLTRETLMVPPDPANLPQETIQKKALPPQAPVGSGFWD